MPVGTIIGAIVAAGATITATAISNAAIEDANEQGLKLSKIAREDELRKQRESERLNKAYIRLQKKELQYKREAELFGRKERAEERGYGRRQQTFSNQLGILNRNDAMRNQLVSIWRRGQ